VLSSKWSDSETCCPILIFFRPGHCELIVSELYIYIYNIHVSAGTVNPSYIQNIGTYITLRAKSFACFYIANAYLYYILLYCFCIFLVAVRPTTFGVAFFLFIIIFMYFYSELYFAFFSDLWAICVILIYIFVFTSYTVD
jgi:hypothetical protein